MKIKCLACKKKKALVERSDYCQECYNVLKQRLHKLMKK